MTPLPHVNTPITLGGLEIRNRIFVAAHSTNFAERISSAQLRDYYAERARGGVGLVIHEPVIVHPSSLSRPTKVWGYDAANIDEYRRTADAIHAEGAAFFCQLLHNGAHMGGYFAPTPVWAPSAVTDPLSGEAAHEMTVEEIAATVEGFAITAEICREGGFDGVELHGSHGYLVQQFLSPLTNRRSDDYGGDEDGRRRFLHEIIEAVRRRVGPDFVVGVRLAGDERAPGGITTADAGALAARLESDGTIDYVNISTGGSAAQGWIVLDATYDRGANLDAAAAVKQATSLPVLVAGRIARPSEAEDALAAGHADMIGVVRALIADPQWLMKGNAGDGRAIRPCTFCNECIAGIGAFRAIRCTVNPDMGHEAEVMAAAWARPASSRRRVAVVGGGPAGMEAALTAAQRGHDVVLFEAGDHLGGQLRWTPSFGLRRELVNLHQYLIEAVAAADIDRRLGLEADANTILALEPDAVIVATGSQSPFASVTVAGAASAIDVLKGSATVGKRVIIAQDGGHPWEFDAVVEHLAAGDHEVVVAVGGPALSGRGGDAGLGYRLARAGVQVLPFSVIVGFAGGEVELRDPLTGATRREGPFDDLVMATTRQASSELVAALRSEIGQVEAVGDSLAPRAIRDAINEGRAAARRIE
jgi:2,4-dienoyl-CoA reductase (NADPH2)